MPIQTQLAEEIPPFRVLCVDDAQDVADSTVALLAVMGFEARACYDGFAALRLNAEFRPSICFVDLNMPGMDGCELAARLQAAAWKPLLLVAMTAISDGAIRARTRAAGFGLHLVKPVDPHKLIGVVDALYRSTVGSVLQQTR